MTQKLFKKSKVVLLLSFCALLGSSFESNASGLIHTDGTQFKDTQGRTVLLRGINLSNASKVPPFQAITDPAQLGVLKALGFNMIRLLFIWEAYEPQPSQYSQAYLDQLGAIVKAAGDLGIYTVVDFHMDGFSRYSAAGCGSGAPAWTLARGHTPDEPSTSSICHLWSVLAASEYLVPGGLLHDTMQIFYQDNSELHAVYMKVWERVTEYFKDYPTLIGYDLLNEPWGDEKTQIEPLYEKIAKLVRAQDPQAILFVEPGAITVTGWVQSALPKPSFDNFVIAPHIYDAFALDTGMWFDGGMFVDSNLKNFLKIGQDWHAPVFVGEFGANGSGGIALQDLMVHYYQLFDQNFVSGAQWDYSPTWNTDQGDGWNHEDLSIVDASGKVRNNFIARPYPAAVAGTPGALNVPLSDLTQLGTMDFEWDNQPELGATEFALPSVIFSDVSTVNYTADSDVNCNVDIKRSRLICQSPTLGKKNVKLRKNSVKN